MSFPAPPSARIAAGAKLVMVSSPPPPFTEKLRNCVPPLPGRARHWTPNSPAWTGTAAQPMSAPIGAVSVTRNRLWPDTARTVILFGPPRPVTRMPCASEMADALGAGAAALAEAALAAAMEPSSIDPRLRSAPRTWVNRALMRAFACCDPFHIRGPLRAASKKRGHSIPAGGHGYPELRSRRSFARVENLLDPSPEEAGNAEREREARVVAPGLQCVHCLPGNVELVGQHSLCPAAFFAQHFEAVVHGFSASRRLPHRRSSRAFRPQR